MSPEVSSSIWRADRSVGSTSRRPFSSVSWNGRNTDTLGWLSGNALDRDVSSEFEGYGDQNPTRHRLSRHSGFRLRLQRRDRSRLPRDSLFNPVRVPRTIIDYTTFLHNARKMLYLPNSARSQSGHCRTYKDISPMGRGKMDGRKAPAGLTHKASLCFSFSPESEFLSEFLSQRGR